VKILLVDDHAIVRDGLRAILEKSEAEVVGESSDGHEAVALVRTLAPDVVIMDVTMKGLNGIEATRLILKERPRTKIMALSIHTDPRYVAAMFAAGAVGYLTKDSAAGELMEAIDTISRHRQFIGRALRPKDDSTSHRRPGSSLPAEALSPREREVLQLLAEGHTSKEIGARLGIALPTVETHRKQIMAKLGLRTVAELTKFAVREGLTSLDE
jgi:DNA-binding NarL/FixJ family response regulator